jgi:two-component system, OmpR family, response regulator
MKRVLVIEDDPTLSQHIREALLESDLEVEIAFDAFIALRLMKKQVYDCIILDINLPGKNGFDICQDFRQVNAHTPILMVTAFGELEDKVKGYSVGADDYLTKPFYMRELLLRVNALIKRSKRNNLQGQFEHRLMADDIMINQATKTVTRQGVDITLTPREFELLVLLIQKKGELISKRELMKEVWGSSIDTTTNTIEVYINFLRNKIDKPFNKQSIKTKVGFGYYFDEG